MKTLVLIITLLGWGTQGFAQRYIPKAKAVDDLNFLTQTLNEVHYNPYHYVNAAVYRQELSTIIEQLPDSVSFKELTLHLYRITSLLEDSHTNPAIQQMPLLQGAEKNFFFPYRIVAHEDAIYLPKQATLPSHLWGVQLVSVNGHKVAPLFAQFKTLYGGRDAYATEMATRLFGYFLFLSELKPPFTMEYKNTRGSITTTDIGEGISCYDAISLAMPGVVGTNEFSIVEDRLGYLNFKNMYGDWQSFSELLEKAFAECEEKGIRHVAVDLRENSGGDSLLGEVLFGFITEAPFLMQARKQWKISNPYKQHLLDNGNTTHEYLDKEVGSVWDIVSCNPSPSRLQVAETYSGEVYFITGAFTFSSANMVADAAKHYGLGTLLGTPTGENTVDFGEVVSITLPNSGLLINITTSLDTGAHCDESELNPVTPHILLEPNLAETLEQTDVAIQYLLKNISE